ncbi:uncharacterized protein [Diadema setosum]|uniref:uncharacterized protein n=1 Tax=Diadema setosum TaxID=31175 RepID=UPI003B3AD99B
MNASNTLSPTSASDAKPGKEVILSCPLTAVKVKRNTIDHATWYHQDQNRETESGRKIAEYRCQSSCEVTFIMDKYRYNLTFDFSRKSAELVIANVGPEDTGKYVCVVGASEGIIQIEIQLNVTVAAVDVQTSSSNSTVNRTVIANIPTDLTCSIDSASDPDTTVRWETGYDIQLQMINNSGRENGASVRFVPKEKHQGKYIDCIVTNDGVETRQRVLLHVQVLNIAVDQGHVVISNGTEYQGAHTCFYLGVYKHGQFLRRPMCYHNSEAIPLPKDEESRDFGIVVCSMNMCSEPIRIDPSDDTNHMDAEAPSIRGHVMVISLSIAVIAIVGVGCLSIVVVHALKKNRAESVYGEAPPPIPRSPPVPPTPPTRSQFFPHEVNTPDSDHIYDEAAFTVMSALPRPPSSWFERSVSFNEDVCDPDVFCSDDDRHQLSPRVCEDTLDRCHPLASRIGRRTRSRTARSSTSTYNMRSSVRRVLDRVKAVGWSYF